MAVILGSNGMLGSMMKRVMPNARTLNRPMLDAKTFKGSALFDMFINGQPIINCIGLIKPYCYDSKAAIKINALFPHYLPKNTIQIATDCVYSGYGGDYVETDPHDATDVYGKTKSLGESEKLINLRCSIIGPEKKNHLSLLDWFLAQQGSVNGYTNHYWNGLTTYHFALIVRAIVGYNVELPSLQHLIPADVVTKAELLQIIAEEYGLKTKVKPVKAPEYVYRTLSTSNPQLNNQLWKLAGYDKPPTIKQMIKELAAL